MCVTRSRNDPWMDCSLKGTRLVRRRPKCYPFQTSDLPHGPIWRTCGHLLPSVDFDRPDLAH